MKIMNINNQNMNQPCSFNSTFISYKELQPVNPELWDGQSHSVSIFRTIESINKDLKNIKTLFYHITDFIRNKNLKK